MKQKPSSLVPLSNQLKGSWESLFKTNTEVLENLDQSRESVGLNIPGSKGIRYINNDENLC